MYTHTLTLLHCIHTIYTYVPLSQITKPPCFHNQTATISYNIMKCTDGAKLLY